MHSRITVSYYIVLSVCRTSYLLFFVIALLGTAHDEFRRVSRQRPQQHPQQRTRHKVRARSGIINPTTLDKLAHWSSSSTLDKLAHWSSSSTLV